MGMIRVSDHAERLIREMSNGRTITATVDAILAGGADKKSEGNIPLDSHFTRISELIDKRFDELKSLIEDHLVDALASSSISGSKQTPGIPKFLKWGNVQYIMFELLEDDGAPEWIVSESMLDRIKNDTYLDSATFTVKGDVVCINDSPLIRITPRVREAIDEERVCE